MTGKTHRVGGMLCVLGCFSLMESKGMLLKNVDPILQLAVMYPFAIYGSIFPDLDHDAHSIPSKDIVSVAVNKVLHASGWLNDILGNKSEKGILSILDAKHRSWQTHSDLFLILLLYGIYWVLSRSGIGSVESTIFVLLGEGFLLGVVSHLILDMLTPEGVWFISSVALKKITRTKKVFPQKISFVPNIKFFSTSGPWETLVRRILWGICALLFVRLIYLISPYRIVFSF